MAVDHSVTVVYLLPLPKTKEAFILHIGACSVVRSLGGTELIGIMTPISNQCPIELPAALRQGETIRVLSVRSALVPHRFQGLMGANKLCDVQQVFPHVRKAWRVS